MLIEHRADLLTVNRDGDYVHIIELYYHIIEKRTFVFGKKYHRIPELCGRYKCICSIII